MEDTDQIKPSYTSRLITSLKDNAVEERVLDLIRAFAKQEGEKREKEAEATKGMYTWGKYKGKKIVAVWEIDANYVRWSAKNAQYLRADQLEIINALTK